MQPANDNKFVPLSSEQVFYLNDLLMAFANAAQARAEEVGANGKGCALLYAHQMGMSTGILEALGHIITQQTLYLEGVSNAKRH
jgi:hypothetical protein